MSDLDEFMASQEGAGEDPNQGSDLEHFMSLVGKNLGRGAVTGIGYAADVLGNLFAPNVMNAIQTPKNVLTGHGVATEATDKAYNTIVPETKPRNDLEEFVASAAQGVGSAVLAGPEGGLAGLARAVIGGAAGGAAAKAAYDYTGNETAAALAGLGAGAAAGLHGSRSNPVRAGMSHPDFAALADRVVPALEGGGTLDNPKVNSKSGAMGPMQVTPETARDPGYGIKPWDGQSQADLARVGREKLAVMLHKYDGDVDKALAAYNWGEGNVDHAIATHGDEWFSHAPAETQHYVLSGKMRLGMDMGSTGGPVPPMDPAMLAEAMNDHPSDALQTEAPDPGEVIDASDTFEAKQYKTLYNKIVDIADTADIKNSGYNPDELENLRSNLNDEITRLTDVYNEKPQLDVLSNRNLLIEMDNMLKEAIANLGGKPRLYAPDAADNFIGQEPKPVRPANDPAEDITLNEAGASYHGDGNGGGPGKVPPYGYGGEPPYGGGRDREPPFGGGGDGEGPKAEPEDKYAGSINLNRMAISQAAKENIKLMAAPMNMDIETFNETRQKAQELIDKKGPEGVLNTEAVPPKELAAHATAIRAIHAAAQEHMIRMNEEFLDPARNSEVAHVRWLHARDVLAAAHEANQNVAKGLGRGLGALRIEVGGTEGNLGEKVGDLMKTRASDEEVARMIQEHPEEAAKIARDSKKPGMNEVIFTTWYAMLLSSLKTLSKNVLSNSLMNILDTAVIHPVAAGIGLLHGGEKVTFRATAAGMAGLAQGAVQGLKNAPEAYRRGSPSDFAERTQAYWKPENKGIGRVISAPMRVLSAQDQVFLDAAQNAEYFRQAHIKAAAEGLSGDEYKARVQDLLENPTKAMEKQAVKYAQMMRFQDPMEFKGLEYATRATPKDPLMIKIMKGFLRILFPFPRNSDRMFFAAMRNSPLGILEPQNLRDFRAGGAKRDVAMARVLVGTGISMAVYLWAANGGITGANPSDPSKKFMINFPGGVHVSYQGLADPFSTTVAAIATAVEDAKTGTEDIGSKVFRGTKDLLGVLMSSTWATGASQFFQAADDNTGKTMQAWVGRMASSFTTPALVREINQDYVDPTVRNTKGNPIVDNVKAGIPGLSQTLPAKHDQFGDKIVRENPGYMNAINPARVQIDKHPGLSKDLADIETPTPLLSKAPNHVTIDGTKHTLSARGQEKYQAVSGRIFQQMMEQNRSQLQYLPNDEKVKLVRRTLSEARKQARAELWGATS